MNEQNEKQAIEEMDCKNCLHHLACLVNCEYVPTPCCAYEDKAGYRKQIEGEWISVDERLPEKYTYVITYDKGLGVVIDSVLSNGEFVLGHSTTHWMPLPEPPKMKGGD